MKKLLCIFLCFTILVTVFTGCNVISDDNNVNSDNDDTWEDTKGDSESIVDVWDGSIADGFSAGDGTENDPYQVHTASELAYLSQRVNNGNDINNDYFVLCVDIDLNNIEWIPIGTYKNKFSGYFNGDGHTIKNLRIPELLYFTTIMADTTSESGVAGLFGVCENVYICDMRIENISITIPDKKLKNIYLGGLIGYIYTESECKVILNNIDILSSSVVSVKSLEKGTVSSIGGLIGYAFLSDTSVCEIKNISSNVNCDTSNKYSSINYVGALIGYIRGTSIKCSDLSNTISYTLPDSMVHSYLGAFGCVNHVGEGNINISNSFSKVSITKTTNDIPFYENDINAIIGKTNQSKNSDGTTCGKYNFENLYGYVEPVGSYVGFDEIQLSLYSMPSHAEYTEKNCVGCVALPENHGLDENIWDLTSLSEPKLKFK